MIYLKEIKNKQLAFYILLAEIQYNKITLIFFDRMQIDKQEQNTQEKQNKEQEQYNQDFDPIQQSIQHQGQKTRLDNNEKQFNQQKINNKSEVKGVLWQRLLNQQENQSDQRKDSNQSKSRIQNSSKIPKKNDNLKIQSKSNNHQKQINKQQDERNQIEENIALQNETTAHKKQDQDRESRIKDTIDRITKNIIVSKQSIVEDISSITRYQQDNQKQISFHHRSGIKYQLVSSRIKGVLNQKPQEHQQKQAEKIVKVKMVEHLKKKMQESQKIKQQQRKRKKEIYQLQKQVRKQQQKLQKNQSKIKKDEIQKRIIYQQKFISRRSGSSQIPITQQEVKAFEHAFIQHIKQRLNIGKVVKLKSRHKSLQKIPQNNKNGKVKYEYRKNYNKKINKNQKLKQKIIINLKQKIQNQLEPTYESILTNSKQIQNSQGPERKRTHQSAPDIHLPIISPTKSWRRTFYSKQDNKPHKIHILKLSQEKDHN